MSFTRRSRNEAKTTKDKVRLWRRKKCIISHWTNYEHGIIIRSLNDEKTDLMNEGKSTDAVDDLIIKVGTAPKKKFRVIEKERSCESR